MTSSLLTFALLSLAVVAGAAWWRERGARRAAERSLRDAKRHGAALCDELERQTDLHAKTLQTIAEGVITVDPSGRVQSMNPAAEDWTGWPEAVARGQPIEQVFNVAPIDDAGTAGAAKATSTGGSGRVLSSRNGTQRRVNFRNAAVVQGDGSALGTIVSIEDVTARHDAELVQRELVEAAQAAEQSARLAQRELSVAHEKFAAFMANFPYPAFMQDERGEFVFINAAGTSTAAWRDAAALRATSAPTSETVSIPAHDRHYFCIRFPLNVDGRPWLGGIAIDVSERIRAERALAERTAELETLFASVPAPLWIARDPHASEIIGNPAACELLGLPEGANIADQGPWLFLHDGRPVERDALPIRTAMRERRALHGTDMELVRGDGARCNVRVTAAPLFDVNGQVRGAVAAGLDISQIKAYEHELERAVRRRDEFLAVLAHELRNPLAPIRNAVQILQRAPHDVERVRRATAAIDRQTSQIVRLIDDLLDVARISQGLVDLDIAPRRVPMVVDGALDVVREQAQKTGHVVDVLHEAPDALVLVDALRAEQILVNLLSNALKYSLPRTRVTVRSWREEAVARISVTDEGQGIPPEFLSEIFVMFARPGLDAKTRISGMGVGLALARQLAEQQGGALDVASEGRGRGATFTVTFPLAGAATDVVAA